ncbi:TetR/AcrR family transcriptional regulator, partial [Klebsiella pneumoniae]|uniref:TetR/AcrR family transcriptional regulator n=1 Tax=Klebsiella pneumoniae TaxID=573 RepID=UPI0019539E38
ITFAEGFPCQAETCRLVCDMPPQPARKPGHIYHHGDLRDALIKAALREAERGGAEAISIKALAKQLGVSQPAPYRHFADRDA